MRTRWRLRDDMRKYKIEGVPLFCISLLWCVPRYRNGSLKVEATTTKVPQKKGRIKKIILERCVPVRTYEVPTHRSRHSSLCSPTLVPNSCDDNISPFHTLSLPLSALACTTTLKSMTLWMHHKPWFSIACSNCGCPSYRRRVSNRHTYNVALRHSEKLLPGSCTRVVLAGQNDINEPREF